MVDGRLRLHGWSFDIKECEIRVYVPEHDAFEPLTPELAARMEDA